MPDNDERHIKKVAYRGEKASMVSFGLEFSHLRGESEAERASCRKEDKENNHLDHVKVKCVKSGDECSNWQRENDSIGQLFNGRKLSFARHRYMRDVVSKEGCLNGIHQPSGVVGGRYNNARPQKTHV